ncbi:flavodoxin family protein, partial [Chloroflexota bacterium]
SSPLPVWAKATPPMLPANTAGTSSANRRDDVEEICVAMETADGIIFGSPVFVSGMSSTLKALFDRMRPFALRGDYCWKVGGAVAVAGMESGGGHDTCLQDIHNSLTMMEFIGVTGLGSGGAGVSGPPYGPPLWNKEEFGKVLGVERHAWGKYSCRMVGRRVAEVSKILKRGKASFGDNFAEEFCHSYHLLGFDPRLMKKLLY